ncbi:hypothetical protein C8J56DRAFT_929722 [Mycena floridula]|nr:hypothetical protein C8J56DRAFT_929722 [Mycena floridula]
MATVILPRQTSLSGISSSFAPSFTALLVGLVVSAFLAGLGTLQTVAFFWVNKSDPLGHKCAVGLLWALSMFEVVCHVYSIHSFSVGTGITVLPWTFRIQVWTVSLVAVITQGLYVMRLWALSQGKMFKRYLTALLFIMVLAEFAFGLFTGAELFSVPSLPGLRTFPMKWGAYVTMAMLVVNDILIAIALVYAFVTGNTNLTWTGSSITMFSAYVFNTGVTAAIFSIFALIAWVLDTTSPTLFVALIVLPQVYTNCFLAMMNARFYFHAATKLPSVFLPTAIDRSVSRLHDRTMSSTSRYSYRKDSHSSSDSMNHLNPPQLPQLTINQMGFPLFNRANDHQQISPSVDMPLEILVETHKQHSVTRYR